MKKFVSKEITFDVEFMGEKVQVRKLPMSVVREIREYAEKQNSKKNQTEEDGEQLMLFTFQKAVVGAEELTMEDLEKLPLPEMNYLFREIMRSIGVVFDEETPQTGN